MPHLQVNSQSLTNFIHDGLESINRNSWQQTEIQTE